MQIESQWNCLRQNLGEWQGSFTQLAPTGAIRSDTPSILTLAEVAERGTIHLVLQRWPEGQSPSKVDLEFGPPGPAPETMFFESGAFSQGPAQRSPNRSFGAEMAFTTSERRLRLVPMFSGATFDRITVIRERRAGSEAPERPVLKATDLVGTWQGEAIRRFPDLERSPETFATEVRITATGSDALEFGPDATIPTDTPQIAKVSYPHVHLAAGRELMLLPAGGYVGYPTQWQYGQAFALEAGWLLASDRRERLIRRYGDRGEWLDLTWIRETRVT